MGNAPVAIATSWNNAEKLAGIADFNFHDLRHCAASYLAMNGATSGEIAEVLGHKTLAMVKRYAHLSETYKKSRYKDECCYFWKNRIGLSGYI